MLDGKANGCSQWFLSHRSVVSGLEKPLLAGYNCEGLDEKHRIAVQGIFVDIIVKAGGASVKVTDSLFAFAFCKK